MRIARGSLFAWGAFFAFLGVVFALNACYSFCSDDCAYGLSSVQEATTGVPAHLGSLEAVWAENVQDGYRPVVHFFVRAFTGWLGKGAFNVANTAMMGALLLLLLRVGRQTWRLEWRSTILAVALVFLVLCKGEAYLWCAGSVNYLWAGTATLAFCLLRERLEAGAPPAWGLAPMMAFALLCGWTQESFALPVCFALGLCSLLRLRALTLPMVLVYGCYGLGALLVVLSSLDRAQGALGGDFSVLSLALTQLKIWAAVKGVWALILCFVFMRDRMGMVRRNAFELLVVLGSLLMISLVGFNGERSLWCANLFALLVVVREFRPPRWLAGGVAAAMVPLCAALIVLGVRIKANFDAFTQQFLASPDGVACHERVACGPLARFFHQALYRWQADDLHGQTYAFYHGRAEAPIALPRELYDELYLKGSFCVPANRLPIEGEFYSSPQANAIVMPLPKGDTTDWAAVRPKVTYAFPKGFRATLEREFARRRLLPTQGTRVLPTPHGDYLLIGKEPESDAFIRDIRLEMPEARLSERTGNV